MEENYMKKILSLGAAAAVLSLTAVAASAAVTPTITPDAPVAGETITVEVVANGMTQDATQFTVAASDNLTLVDGTPVDGGYFNTATAKFAWAGTAAPADGTTLLTLTYTVDAAADEEVSVSLTPDDGFTDISADAVSAVVVAGADEDEPDVSEESEEPTTTDEGSVESEDASSEDAGLIDATSEEATGTADADDNSGSNKDNPDTGVALAVVPAVLAGAAIIVAKKRK